MTTESVKYRRRLLLIFSVHQRRLFSTVGPHDARSKNQKSVNDHLSSLCKRRLHREALNAFRSLQLQGPAVRLYPRTYAHLVLACSALRDLAHGRRIHRHLMESGSPPDIILCNHILNMYGKCGAFDHARELFDAMTEKNVVTWASMIAGYSQNRREREAVELYVKMLDIGVLPDEYTLCSVVRACSAVEDVELGPQLHCHVVKLDKGADKVFQNALVSMYSKLGKIAEASLVFARIKSKDLVSWGSMIAGYSQQGFGWEALALFKEMLSMGVHQPNEFLFGSVFSVCGSLLQLECAEELHGLCLKYGWVGDSFVGCSLTDMYAKCRMLESATKAFCHIDFPDSISWNSIISAFAYGGDPEEATFFFSEMRASGFKPDDVTVRSLLCAFSTPASLVKGQLIHGYVVKMGLIKKLEVYNALLAMYTKCSDTCVVFNLFGETMHDTKNLVSWNTILTACLKHNQLGEVFRLLKQLHDTGYKLDQITLNIILSACAELTYLEMGHQIHSHCIRKGLEADPTITNGLIDTYAKCGLPEVSMKLFEFVGYKCDVVSWSSLIVGYAQSGDGEKALELFNNMQALGVRPNHVTFVGVLSACSKIGLTDEGKHYFQTMEGEYGVAPTMEHYSCMVDLLARAGRLMEAESFINEMPIEPDVVVWKSLLASCSAWGNLEIGERAAAGILRLDPLDSVAHVLLSNIYASAGRWHELAGLRSSMKDNCVKKAPGKSWI